MSEFGLVSLSENTTLAGDIGSKDADIAVQRPEVRITQGIGGLIGRAKSENHLADVAFMNERQQLRAVAELQGRNNI